MSTHLNHKGEACRRVWFAKATDGVGGYLNANGDVGPRGHVLSSNRAEAEAACLAYVTQAQKYADKRYGRAMTITPVDATDEEKAKAKAESARSA